MPSFGIMTIVSDRIIALQSYDWTDWAVTQAERRSILALLRGDRDMAATIRDLHGAGQLSRLLANFLGNGGVDERSELAELAQILGSGAGGSSGALVEGWRGWSPRLLYLFRLSRDLHESYRRLGGAPLAVAAVAAPADLMPTGADSARAPFGGAGATGIPGTSLSIPLTDQFKLWRGDSATTARYSNPIPGSLPGYIAGLSAVQRRAQARHLLLQPIHSVVAQSYRRGRPSRAGVMTVAGRVHRLEPAMIAAFILAEQRDQSRNEDAKDYGGAVNPIAQANTSIGLGQVVISTARNNALFADLLRTTAIGLSHDQIAELLVSEEFNIFAVARYLRLTADAATGKTAITLPQTNAKFPGINFLAYGRPSAEWPIDNIRALGSEYTSRAWDDRLSPGWGDFVYEAYMDMKSAGVF